MMPVSISRKTSSVLRAAAAVSATVMNIHAVQDLGHAGTMLIVHLPAERILINADLYSPALPSADRPTANDSMRALAANIERLGLDVARHVGVHGLVGSHVDFTRIVNGE